MIQHYILTAWRNLLKNRTYSLIHLCGLSLALVACIVLAAYLANEFRYDGFHEKGDRICRLNLDIKLPDQKLELALVSGAMAPALAADFPEVARYVRLASPWGELAFQQGSRSFFEKKALYADPAFFEVFDFKLQAGNPKTILQQPYEIVLTEHLAKKYFGEQNPVGATLTIDKQLFTVTGIAASPPENSHLDFDCVLSWATWAKEHPAAETNWTWTSAPTYLLLAKGTDRPKLQSKLANWVEKRIPAAQKGTTMTLSFEPFEGIHFSPARLGDLKPKANPKQLFLLALTGIFILLMAIFNYVNLATAINSSRMKEIGVRKTYGANRRQIAGQFLAESILLAALAIACAIMLAIVVLPFFSRQIGYSLGFGFLSPGMFVVIVLIGLAGIGLLAGGYPALVVSGWKLAKMFREKGNANIGGFGLRQLLTGAQFIISISLIIGTLVVWKQYDFLNSQSLGFDRQEKIIARFGSPDLLSISPETLKKELLKLPEVQAVSLSSHVPSELTHSVYTTVKNENGEEKAGEVELTLVDADFFDLYGLQFLAGRNFSEDLAQDTAGALILTESAVKLLGFATPEAIIGKDFNQWDRSGKVIGVIKDYHQHSLHTQISPMTFQMNPALFEKVTIGFRGGDLSGITKKLEQTWREVAPTTPFQFTFFEEQLAQQYLAERRFAAVFIAFTLMAIFISCLGLFGLTAIAITRRTKEIGIRKVLGASTSSIMVLFSKNFITLVFLALLVASPLAWYLMQKWLEDFAYRTKMEWWLFVVAGLLAFAIALLTVSFQSIKAALVNPVDSLRSE